MTTPARRPVVLGALCAAALLLAAAPAPAAALRTLRAPAAAPDPTGPLVALVALLAWTLAAWLLVAVALTAGGHLPGVAGRVLHAVARRTVPAAVRRSAEVALGLTVAVGVLGASPAAAATDAERLPAPATAGHQAGAPLADAGRDLDWPTAPAVPATGPDQQLDRPAVEPPAVASGPAAGPAPRAGAVVVRPGDTLWGLAESDLRAGGTAAPTDAQVAQAWPAWWAANRDVVGDDPDLLHPGTPLLPPPAP